jgi:para-nitrobenzyl esterase
MVYVSFNYRLNVFGYMALEILSWMSNTGVSGNYGLTDQIQALKWVQENIAAFGGDPDQVPW